MVIIAPIEFWLPAFFSCLVWLSAIYPFPRIPSRAASDFHALLSCPTGSSGLEHRNLFNAAPNFRSVSVG